MTRERLGRCWCALTAAAATVGLVLSVVVAIRNPEGHFSGAVARTFNVFCYFTIQSNLLVAVTCFALAVGAVRGRLWLEVLRVDGLLGITVTFVVYHRVLAGAQNLSGTALVSDTLVHTVSPVMAILGWLVFGPRKMFSTKVIWWSLAWPVAWLVFTLVRGPIVDWYPYPFIDVREHGYAVVLLNCLLVAGIFIGLAWVARAGDHLLGARSSPQPTAGRDRDQGRRSGTRE